MGNDVSVCETNERVQSGMRLHPFMAGQPGSEKTWPCGGAGEVLREDDTMRSVFKEVHLNGDVVVGTGLVDGEAVLDGDNTVAGGGKEEYGGRVGGDMKLA